MNGNNVRLQNLRDFTVQIRNADDQIVGTGIAVSTDGKIVTCAHVVQAALGAHPRLANGAEVGVYFPQVRGGEEKKRKAVVEKFFIDNDDDVVLLQLTSGASPLAPEQIAVLGMAEFSEGNPFRTYGYSPIGTYPATRGDGIILGTIEPPSDRNLQSDPVQLKSRDIASGMSGAAVLDVARNLVVGLVAERFYSPGLVQDEIGFGVDSRVLTFAPFDFDVRGEALQLRPAPEFKLGKDLFIQAIEIASYVVSHRSPTEKYSWNNAPSVLAEWTGRNDLLKQITDDWNNPQKHVTGLIGFGGEGKSSLARKWVETILLSTPLSPPSDEGGGVRVDGVFWWSFYENRSVDEFLETTLKYMSGGGIDPFALPSSNLRAQIIGAMLGAGHYLFVLDGLEVMQHQEGDRYGLLQSNDLHDLLTFFARPDNQSFCLITSRASLLDLIDYTTYTHHDVERLTEEDGRALLRKLDIKGSDLELNKVVTDWDGHALTLSILAAYLAESFDREIKHLSDIPIPTANEPRYERVHRVLRRYDESLTKDEREFLKLFSIFRLPVQELAFEKVFIPLLPSFGNRDTKHKQNFLTHLFSSQTLPNPQTIYSEFTNLLNRLVTYRLIRHDEHEKSYTTHPLIRNHYFTLFTHPDLSRTTRTFDKRKQAHTKIKDYYLSIAGNDKKYPTLDDLKPLIEVVHHACEAKNFNEAWQIYWERIAQQTHYAVVHQLGAYETDLGLITEFFHNGDLDQEPQVTNEGDKRWLINAIGFRLMNLGRLREAVPFYVRAATSVVEAQDWHNASIGYRNLAELYTLLGALNECAKSAKQALDFARQPEIKRRNERNSLKCEAWANHLIGNLQMASDSFAQAEKLERQIDPGKRYLFSLRGIQHADHLRRTNQVDYARRVTEANLETCERNHFAYTPGMCHRVLGDLDADAGNYDAARLHYDAALKRARNESDRAALIEALLARGRWQAKHPSIDSGQAQDVNAAFNDLNVALGYCVESGYRIYEADTRVALAWAYIANGEKEKAKQSAERAMQMSNEMGYHWGTVDAKEVLERIENRE